ncbi:MAG: NfeD family protein [Candidatus Methylacidiphilales bacterium]|nr:NfeD family protein [Candidatus Methylacidiphilales bacterium]
MPQRMLAQGFIPQFAPGKADKKQDDKKDEQDKPASTDTGSIPYSAPPTAVSAEVTETPAPAVPATPSSTSPAPAPASPSAEKTPAAEAPKPPTEAAKPEVPVPPAVETPKVEAAIPAASEAIPRGEKDLVYILTLDDEVSPLMELKARRGVKEAIEMKADALILRIDTNGGMISSTQELIKIIGRFPHQKRIYAYVDNRALSAGAMLAATARNIYMAPSSFIGAASPLLINQSDGKVMELPKLVQGKFLSATQAMIRTVAETNGHNPILFEAMVNPEVEVKIGDKVVHAKGQVLTLTAAEAELKYGKPPRPLLSMGTVPNLDAMVRIAGGDNARRAEFKASGFESIAEFLVYLSPLLVMAAFVLAYLEFQKPGTMIFGGLAAVCFLLQFFAHQVAGLTGSGPMILFIAGVAFVLLEIFLVPGSIVLGGLGLVMMVGGLILSMTDIYPTGALIPDMDAMLRPMVNVTISLGAAVISIILIAHFLPKRVLFAALDAATVSGPAVAISEVAGHRLHLGEEGEAITMLRPSGTARFGGVPVDVVTDGIMVPKGTRVVIEKIEGMRTVVRPLQLEVAKTAPAKARLEL